MLKLLLLIERCWPLALVAVGFIAAAAWVRGLGAMPARMTGAAFGRSRSTVPRSAI